MGEVVFFAELQYSDGYLSFSFLLQVQLEI